MRKTGLLVSVLAAGLLVESAPAHAFRMIQNTSTGRVTAGNLVACNASGGFAHWTRRHINWFLNTGGQGSDKAGAIQAALQTWTNAGLNRYFTDWGGTTGAGWATDGTNAIVFANGNGCTGNCLALTALVLQSGQAIVESDITFNAAFTWRSDGLNQDTQAVATHELGHSLGIHHTELTGTPTPTMFETYFGVDGRTLENDDTSAVWCSRNRYPCLTASGFVFGGQNRGQLGWYTGCLLHANVDIFRDGVKVNTSANDGGQLDTFPMGAASANYWVCEAGSTAWYDAATCTDVVTVSFL